MTDDDFDRSRREMHELLAKMKADLEKDTPFNRLYKRNKRYEQAYVNLDEPAIRGMRSTRLVLLLILVFVVIVMAPMIFRFGPWWLSVPASMLWGYLAAIGSNVMTMRATAYRSGWLNGRAAIYDAVRTGHQFKMDPEDVLQVEKLRDISIPFI